MHPNTHILQVVRVAVQFALFDLAYSTISRISFLPCLDEEVLDFIRHHFNGKVRMMHWYVWDAGQWNHHIGLYIHRS